MGEGEREDEKESTGRTDEAQTMRERRQIFAKSSVHKCGIIFCITW